MQKSKYFLILALFLLSLPTFGQEKLNYKWWDPAETELPVIEGQFWGPETKSTYDRLPERAERVVRNAVWNLSRQSAGLVLRFHTNANEIVVKYKVGGNFSMSHMPATGVSGLDLYAITPTGKWEWCAAKRSFGDTVTYRFSGIHPDQNYSETGLEYRLYLPLYNSVKWLKIGVSEEKKLTPLPLNKKKPIVVYGTSIAQGACASRPGMAWTAILGRRMNMPLINLGFSGNGKLEKEMLDLITEIDAKIYILDCLPNMTAPRFTEEEVHDRIITATQVLQKSHPDIPILFVEHDGYTDGFLRPERYKNYADINKVMRQTFSEMQSDGYKNIFLLSRIAINQDIDCQVDGIHPNDLGMDRYAKAYQKILGEILQLKEK
jgi:lysophospholipase L1-like esterase